MKRYLSDESFWYWSQGDGSVRGPFCYEDLQNWYAQASLLQSAWVMPVGGTEWIGAAQLFEPPIATQQMDDWTHPEMQSASPEPQESGRTDADSDSAWLWDHPEGKKLLQRDPWQNIGDYLSGRSPLSHSGPGDPMTGVIFIYAAIIGVAVAVGYGILAVLYNATR